MDAETAQAINNHLQRLRKKWSRYCVSLSYSLLNKPSPKEWQYGTGFLLKINEKHLIVTAGHLIEEIFKQKGGSKLERFHVAYSHISGDMDSKAFEPDEIDDGTFVVAQGFDAGFIRLQDDWASEIERNDNTYFTPASFLRGALAASYLPLVMGYPVQLNVFTQNEAFVTRQSGTLYQHNEIGLGSVGLQTTLLSRIDEESAALPVGFDCEVGSHKFRPFLGQINSNPNSLVTSAVGMSGGPIIAITTDPQNDETFEQPRILGIQSKQTTREKTDGIEITSLEAVSSSRLSDWIAETA